ncbi:hypothetical protein J2Z21_009289 [Streptomyces griseochromogenes]|uniref:Uncharacterized protein n=1 Tax=Streptomyces griseochromogenes TaxID=68214 RepID=A0ABS4M9B4_9ACTN|nr:hypothetical protein [Streptomyces griseochromogenes]
MYQVVLGKEELPVVFRQTDQGPASQWSGPQVKFGVYVPMKKLRPRPFAILSTPQIMLRNLYVGTLHDFLRGYRRALAAYLNPHGIMSADCVDETLSENRRIDFTMEINNRGSVIGATIRNYLLLQPNDLL